MKASSKSLIQLSYLLFVRQFNNKKMMFVILGFPVFVLLSLWLPSSTGSKEDLEVMYYMYPAVTLLATMMPGITAASQVSEWRSNGTSKRLLLTKTPYFKIIRAIAASKIVLSILQGIAIITLCNFLVQLKVNWFDIIVIISIFTLTALVFTGFGILVGLTSKKPDNAIFIYLSVLLPLFFLGSFPADMLPDIVNVIAWFIPVDMAVTVLNHTLMNEQSLIVVLPELIGLFVYVLLLWRSIYSYSMKTERLLI